MCLVLLVCSELAELCTHPAQPLRAADTGVLGPVRTVKLARKPSPRGARMQRCFIPIPSQQTRRLRERVSAGVGSRQGAGGATQAGPEKGEKQMARTRSRIALREPSSLRREVQV